MAGRLIASMATPTPPVKSASPRGDPPASVLNVAGEVSEVAGAFSAAEMRRSGREAAKKPLDALANGFANPVVPARQEVGRLPPSSFADPVSAPGSPEHRPGVAAGTRSASPTSTAISAEARRRFQQAAATSAHARAFPRARSPGMTKYTLAFISRLGVLIRERPWRKHRGFGSVAVPGLSLVICARARAHTHSLRT